MNHNVISTFRTLAYRDYIASRFLLNNNFPMQGVMLASTAIEKYLKIRLFLRGWYKRIHLDKIELIRKAYADFEDDTLNRIDNHFLYILSNAYKLRYYEEDTKPISVGFFPLQLLGEMDHAVWMFEKLITVTDGNEEHELPSLYQMNVEDRNPDLLFNNFVLNDIDKKEFMERPQNGYCLYVDTKIRGSELEVIGKNVKNKYEGKIALIQVKTPNTSN